MKCELVKDNIILANYGELPDEFAGGLEQHLDGCDDCRREWDAMQIFHEKLALLPVEEPSPNLVAQSRMRLDDALDLIPPHGFLTRLRSNFFSCLGYVQSAPALAAFLVGVGFLGGNFTYRYQAAHLPKKIPPTVRLSNPSEGSVANVTGIVQTPNSEIVQVKYNRMVPESMEGSLDSPAIRELLLMGTHAATNNEVRTNSVSLLADECIAGHACLGGTDPKGIRNQLLVSMLYDEDAGVRLKALQGLQRYVGQDPRVRDAIAEALSRDPSADVRKQAITTLVPVKTDSSVRQVLRTVSTQDVNPYIRTASYNALQDAADIQ
jgi:HEAT repeats